MATFEASLEGPVAGLPLLVGTTVTMSVVGVNVIVSQFTADPELTNPPQNMLTPIRTPTGRITLAQLADPTSFDGRAPLQGLDGATAIVEGLYDDMTKTMTPLSVDIEPAENLLLGVLSSVTPLTINDVPVKPVTDPRLAFEGFTNEFGFKVAIQPSLIGTPASAEGYFINGSFFAHTIELDASAPVLPGQPSVSITRARTRRRVNAAATVDLRGGVDFNSLGTLNQFQVAIRRVDRSIDLQTILNSSLIGIEVVTRNVDFPRFGEWRLQGRLTQPAAGIAAGEAFPLTVPRHIQVAPAIPGLTPTTTDFVEEEADVRF